MKPLPCPRHPGKTPKFERNGKRGHICCSASLLCWIGPEMDNEENAIKAWNAVMGASAELAEELEGQSP